MKMKLITLLLALCIAFLFSACGAVSEVENAINQIGIVTMESKEVIENAEELYAALPADKRGNVENYATLTSARKEYNRLSSAIEKACDAIDAIGEVTLDSDSAIKKARNAYEVLESEGLTSYAADKYSTLANAEKAYVQLQYQSARDLLNQKKYQEAYALFDTIMADYPGCSIISDVRNGAADALAGLAEAQYNAGKLEEVVYALKDLSNKYGTTDTVTALWEKIDKRLNQQRPQNGKTFKNTVGWGQGEFTVSASSQDACIKLEDITDPSNYILFYVRGGEKATVKVKDGRYIAKYTTGKYWFGQESMFGQYASFTKAEDIMEFTTTREGSYTYYSAIEITLYQVVGGNMETTAIASEDF